MTSFTACGLFIAVFACLYIGTDAGARVGCPFRVETVATNLNQPVDIAWCGKKMFVAEKPGRVKLVQGGSVRPVPVLDITKVTNDYWDRGLLGLALDKRNCGSYPTWLYVIHTYESGKGGYTGKKTSRVVRYRLGVGDVADLKSAEILIDGIPSDAYTHSAGTVRIDQNGYVWATHGDGVNPGHRGTRFERVQDVNNPSGKMFKMFPDGRGITTNPFYNGKANAVRSKVWAYGLRNPFRFNLRPGYQNTPIGVDVGQYKIEEVNVYTRGGDFGWPCLEGKGPYNIIQKVSKFCRNYVKNPPKNNVYPVFEYNHNRGGVAIVGGDFPSAYGGCNNKYFFGTYSQNTIEALPINANNKCAGNCFAQMIVRGLEGITAVNRGPDGNVYWPNILKGSIRRLKSDRPPGGSCGVTPPGGSYSLSEWWWAEEPQNGRGQVELDQSNGERLPKDSGLITIHGTKYPQGLGVAPFSSIRYFLGGKCSNLKGGAGVTDDRKAGGSVIMKIIADGETKFSTEKKYGQGATAFNIALGGVTNLVLEVSAKGAGGALNAGWANPMITCSCPEAPNADQDVSTVYSLKTVITSPKNNSKFGKRAWISYAGYSIGKDGKRLSAENLTWQMYIRHCVDWTLADCHYHFLQELRGVDNSKFRTPLHEDAWYIEISLFSDDGKGNKGIDTVSIYPK